MDQQAEESRQGFQVRTRSLRLFFSAGSEEQQPDVALGPSPGKKARTECEGWEGRGEERGEVDVRCRERCAGRLYQRAGGADHSGEVCRLCDFLV